MNIVDNDNAESFFGGNSRQLNLQQQRERGETTAAYEIGHMMGFRSSHSDITYFTDDGHYGPVIPLMYSGGDHADGLNQRVRTGADVKGLYIWNNKWEGDGYLGEDINNIIYDK